MMTNTVQKLGVSTTEKTNPSANMSRVVSVESPDSRDEFSAPAKAMAGGHSTDLGMEEEATSGLALRVTQSPMDALRMGMASPFRNFLGLLKPPVLPGSSLHGSEGSPRPSNISATEIGNLCLGSLKLTLSAGAENDTGAEMTSSSVASGLDHETRRDGQSLVVVAFDANVKEVSHAGIVWAMEHVLKRGDILVVVSVLDSIRGSLGYRVRIGDQKWLSANQKLVEGEIQQKMEVWRNFPGLDNRCAEGGVKLVVMVKAAQRAELAICREAVKQGACHVVLDKSLKNRRREFYMQNLSCDVTRIRRSGGVDVIRPSLDMAMMMGLVQRNMKFPIGATEPRSPTSVIPPPLLSYGDQIDVFEISLGDPKPKRVNSSTPRSTPAAPALPPPTYSGELRKHSSSTYPEELKSAELQHHSSSAFSGELRNRSSSAYSGEMKSGEIRHHSSSAYSGELRNRSSSAYSGEMKSGEIQHHSSSAYSGELRNRSSSAFSGEMKSGEIRHHSSSAYSGEFRNLSSSAYSGEMKSGEIRRLSTPAGLPSAYERSSSMSLSTSAHTRSSSASAPSVHATFTSSSNANDHDADDLFSIFHGSTRHTEIDTDIFSNIRPHSPSGYESDDLFSIGNASTRRTSPAPPLEYHHSQPNIQFPTAAATAAAILGPNPRLSLDSLATPSAFRELVLSEPLREATIARITFVLGVGDAVTLTLRHPLRPGEGLLVGSSPAALFLLHCDHHSTSLSAATPASYIAMDGHMAMKLAFLQPDQRVLAVDPLGRCRPVPVAAAATSAAPLLLVEAHCEGRRHTAMLPNAPAVALRHSPRPRHGHGDPAPPLPVATVQPGDRVLLRLRSADPSHAIWSS